MKYLKLLSIAFVLFSFSNIQADSIDPYLKKAKQLELSKEKYWKILLHYKENLLGNFESEIVEPSFFLSSNGKISPEDELNATIKYFLAKENSSFGRPARCRFPARYKWLNSKLRFDSESLLLRQCPEFRQWLRIINPTSLTLVFPSYYLANPASMFGHTFLRFNSANFPKNPLLGFAINFSANVNYNDEGALKYIFFGLFGGYSGVYSIKPYYTMVKEYAEIEKRDIWEYDLNFSKVEMERLLYHLWELDNFSIDYYFLTGNCSFHLLSLLEAARPSLDLQSQFPLWAVPADTLRAVLEPENILLDRSYRPSRISELTHLIELLANDEKSLFFETIEHIEKDPNYVSSTNLLGKIRPKERKAKMLELLGKYYVLSGRPKDKRTHFEIQKQRAKIREKIAPVAITPKTTPPELGHSTSRIAFGAGSHSEFDNFQEFELRLAIHDKMASEIGFLPYSQMEFFKFQLRNYSDQGSTVLENFSLINFQSFTPDDRLKSKLDWKAYLGLQRPEEKTCLHCRIFEHCLLFGESIEFDTALVYLLGGGEYKYGEVYESHSQLNAMINSGVIFQLGEAFRFNLDYTHFYKIYGEDQNYDQIQFSGSFTALKNQDLRFSYLSTPFVIEGRISWQLYY